MATANSENPASTSLSDIPWNDIVRFVRQLSHDLRNHLNAAELQTAFIGEIATDPEIKSEITRLRGMLSELSALLQKLSSDMGHARPTLISYRANDLIEDLKRKIESNPNESKPNASWEVHSDDVTLEIDPQLFPAAIEELLANANREKSAASIKIQTTIDQGNSFVMTILEPKNGFDRSTENWGREPLRSISQRHYGLGLNRARIIIEGHGGQLRAHYDQASKNLVTTIALPITKKGS